MLRDVSTPRPIFVIHGKHGFIATTTVLSIPFKKNRSTLEFSVKIIKIFPMSSFYKSSILLEMHLPEVHFTMQLYKAEKQKLVLM